MIHHEIRPDIGLSNRSESIKREWLGVTQTEVIKTGNEPLSHPFRTILDRQVDQSALSSGEEDPSTLHIQGLGAGKDRASSIPGQSIVSGGITNSWGLVTASGETVSDSNLLSHLARDVMVIG